MTMLHVTKSNFESEVIHAKKPVIIDAYADWCGPCKLMAPIFEQLSQELKEVKFAKMDTESEADLASQFGIMSIPTLMMFNQGEEVERIVGFMPKEVLKKKIEAITKNL
jgi:thioredoxin 1